MQAKVHDAFALKTSGLDAFPYADVGAELNGSALTVLSMIARLGRDPWAEVAEWAALPRAGMVECLARSIGQMPLVPSALARAGDTAERLVQLLPAAMPGGRQDGGAKAEAPLASEWVPVTVIYCAMVLGMALSAILASKPPQAAATPTAQLAAAPVHDASAGPAARAGQ